MPYGYRKKDSMYVVYNKITGAIKGTYRTIKEALKRIRFLEALEHGFKPNKKR